MAKRKLTTLNLNDFMKLDIEKQAEVIEKETRELLKRLPKLKKNLSTYDDVSDELYNLTEEELSLYGSTYASAVRSGSITTSSAKAGYNRFIKKLLNYNSKSIQELAKEYANKRLDDFINNIHNNGSEDEIAYVDALIDEMSDQEKISFTRSKYFLDTDNWNSQDFKKDFGDSDYSMMTLKLELFMISKGHNTQNIYNQSYYGTNESIARPSTRKK